jgi:hypothetical protein
VGQLNENVFKIMGQLNEDSRAVFACIMWSIWKQRNDVVWRNERLPRTDVCERGISLLTGWRNAKEVRERHNTQHQTSQNSTWTRPSEGYLKCNVDASFSRTRNKEGIGVCIRDDCHTLNFAHSFFIGSFIINANLLFLHLLTRAKSLFDI